MANLLGYTAKHKAFNDTKHSFPIFGAVYSSINLCFAGAVTLSVGPPIRCSVTYSIQSTIILSFSPAILSYWSAPTGRAKCFLDRASQGAYRSTVYRARVDTPAIS